MDNINNCSVSDNNKLDLFKEEKCNIEDYDLPFHKQILAKIISSDFFYDIVINISFLANQMWGFAIENLNYYIQNELFSSNHDVKQIANDTSIKLKSLGDKYINKTILKAISMLDNFIDPETQFFASINNLSLVALNSSTIDDQI